MHCDIVQIAWLIYQVLRRMFAASVCCILHVLPFSVGRNILQGLHDNSAMAETPLSMEDWLPTIAEWKFLKTMGTEVFQQVISIYKYYHSVHQAG